MGDIDHTHTNQIVCPHCGHKDQDSWEWLSGAEGDDTAECGDCGKEFYCSRHVSVSYSTRPIEDITARPSDEDDRA